MEMETITSRQNPLCVQIRKLAADAGYRRKTARFLCDSPKLVGEVLRWAPETVEAVVLTEGQSLPDLPRRVRRAAVPEDVMASLAPTKTPQGVLAVCAIPARPLPDRLEGGRYVVLDGVQDPGNVGTVLRTADALWSDGLLLVNGCADLWSPKTLRASMGAAFRCPAWTCTPGELSALLARSGLPLWGAALREDTAEVGDVDWSRAALAIGSEGRGLSPEVLALCGGTVRIPMRDRCEALNAAAAAAVLIWEMAKAANKV